MIVYNYHPETGQLLGQSEADESPLEEGVFLIPAFSTPTIPPACSDAQYVVFNGSAWEIKDIPVEVPVPDPASEPQVIYPISPRQIRQALTALNFRAGVESAVAAGDQDLKDWWEFSSSFERNHPEVIAMGTQLGVSSEQLDALWILAGAL